MLCCFHQPWGTAMKRRDFIAGIGAATAWPASAWAQNPARHPLIAVVVTGSPGPVSNLLSGFPQGMRELGYVEGQNVDIVYRYANGDFARLPALVEEAVRLKPEIIVTGNSAAALAVTQLTTAIPIVAANLIDPVGLGLAVSHARPGKQVTGTLSNLDGLPGKLLELLREVVPGAERFGVLMNTGDPASDIQWRDTEHAAAALPVKLVLAEARTPADLNVAFDVLRREHVNGVCVLRNGMFLNERRRIAELAIAARLPTVYSVRQQVEDGGLISYGIDLHENWRHVAFYVDKILKGRNPGDLPIDLPTKVELVINLKTAKAIGLTIPQSLLLRADAVIE
jgi:putative ABC transport system substrate-binding protein